MTPKLPHSRSPVLHETHPIGRAPPWLGRLRERLDAGEAEPDFRALGREAGAHPRHLMRVFHRFVGCSAGEVVRRGRVRRAQALLSEPRLTLAAVALAAGFYDQSHFTRTFKRVTGLTPGAYRLLTTTPASR